MWLLLLCCVQGEPELERLKRELEELKHAPRGLEGTFRTAAEMERHRWDAVHPRLLANAAFVIVRARSLWRVCAGVCALRQATQGALHLAICAAAASVHL